MLALPSSELAWMAISPAALILGGVGAAKTLARLDLSGRVLRFVTRAAGVAIAGLGLFVFGALIWLVDGGPGPAHLFQAGTVDRVGVVVMTITMIVAIRCIRRTTTLVPIAR